MPFDYASLVNETFAWSIAVYVCLIASIVSLWINRSAFVWGSLLLLSMTCAIIDGRLSLAALIFIGIYAGLVYYSFHVKDKILSIGLKIFVFSMSGVLWYHLAPGFSNWLIADGLQLSTNSSPFKAHLNFDKALIGIFILGFGNHHLLKKKSEWKLMVKRTFPIFCIGVPVIVAMSLFLGYVKWDPKINTFFIIWAINNLFLVCVAEEVLFRGFLQNHLQKYLKSYRYGGMFSLIFTAVMFGAFHMNSTTQVLTPCYFVLATVSGFFYGLIYQKTQSVEGSILAHFILNSLHYSILTYPVLLPVTQTL